MSEQATDAPSVLRKWSRRWFRTSAVLFLLCVALAVGLFAAVRADKANDNIQASCQQEFDTATVPLVSNQSQAVLTIVADARIYYMKVCGTREGALPKPDPRIAAIVAKKQHH